MTGKQQILKHLILVRSKRKSSECNSDPKKTAGFTGSSKKNRKSPMRIRQVFRRSTSKGEDCTDCPSPVSPVATGTLFGIPLNRLGDPDTIPRPVMVCLILTFIGHTFLFCNNMIQLAVLYSFKYRIPLNTITPNSSSSRQGCSARGFRTHVQMIES
jgi:hypothetical protein